MRARPTSRAIHEVGLYGRKREHADARLWRHNGRAIEPLSELLDYLWRTDEAEMRGAGAPGFRRLLQLLAGRQSPLALELVARIGRD